MSKAELVSRHNDLSALLDRFTSNEVERMRVKASEKVFAALKAKGDHAVECPSR